MAESVIFGLATEIIKKLGSLAAQEIAEWWGFRDELEKLGGKVSTIEGVLLHAEEMSLENTEVENWLKMLKEAFYDADDLLDEFSTDALRQQQMTCNGMANKVRLLGYGRKMSPRIKAITNRLDEIAKNKSLLLETRRWERVDKSKGRETHSSPPEVVIGREEDKEAVIQLLLSSNCEEHVSVIPIVGLGGLGKTTLAQHVYNDERVRMHFELRKWVCISDDFDAKLIVEKLVDKRNSEMEALKSLLHQQINGMKYLMVLDDLWCEDFEKWCRLKDLLAGGARGSKIVITTRLRNVAEMTRPVDIHELKGLSDMESWSLFKRIAFKPGQVVTPSHESVGKEIVAKCFGVPLAIRTMGGLLYSKNSESEWLSFKNKELSRIDQKESDILPTLKLSYNHLPSHLKQCFAYCKLFPKDNNINVEYLIQFWIAEGYVKSSDRNECLGNIGVQYFSDLHWRSFFQEVEKDDFGNYKICKMHDLMHDLTTVVAGEECASLSNSEVEISNAKTRHVSLHFDRIISPSLFKANKLRTLLLDYGRRRSIKREHLGKMFSNLRRLRVLDLHFSKIRTLPGSIDKLKHLRYLDLSGNSKMKKLPNSITKLQNLQVLKLNYCSRLTKLPRDMTELVNLRHLENEECFKLSHMPRGIGQLTSLERLNEFVVAQDSGVSKAGAGLSELRGLNKLGGSLAIREVGRVKNGAIECKEANLKEKQHLQCLALDWRRSYDYKAGAREVANEEMELEALEPHQYLKGLHVKWYMGVKLPSWLSSITNLVEILFSSCHNIERVPLSHKLPFLKKLSIRYLKNLEYIETDIRGGASLLYPSLQQLGLVNCPNLKGWKFTITSTSPQRIEKLQFPCLSDLTIFNCPNFTLMPPLQCPSLKQLSCYDSTAKSFEQILETVIVPSESTSSSSSSSPSSSSQLEYLSIDRIEDLEFLPKVLLSNLPSLRDLEITSCGITTLSPDDEDDATQWQGLKSLRSLELEHLPNLLSLPMGLQYLTCLSRLEIRDCPKLMSLPDCMRNLSSLQNLQIQECPELSIRSHNNTAEDWPKIAHIPDIEINGKHIQRNGRYLP